MDLFGCLVFQIIGQQLSVKATRAILERLTRKFDRRMPSAQQVAAELDEQALRDIGFSWRKARTVLDLAARFSDGRLSEKELSAMPDDRVIEELTQITGIGPWTVHGALLIALRRADVVPTGDIMLANTIKTYYDLDHVPSEEEIRDIAVAWHPYGSLGVNLLFAAAELD
jgi:DNA-3-methyladenine glycosylase II